MAGWLSIVCAAGSIVDSWETASNDSAAGKDSSAVDMVGNPTGLVKSKERSMLV